MHTFIQFILNKISFHLLILHVKNRFTSFLLYFSYPEIFHFKSRFLQVLYFHRSRTRAEKEKSMSNWNEKWILNAENCFWQLFFLLLKRIAKLTCLFLSICFSFIIFFIIFDYNKNNERKFSPELSKIVCWSVSIGTWDIFTI